MTPLKAIFAVGVALWGIVYFAISKPTPIGVGRMEIRNALYQRDIVISALAKRNKLLEIRLQQLNNLITGQSETKKP